MPVYSDMKKTRVGMDIAIYQYVLTWAFFSQTPVGARPVVMLIRICDVLKLQPFYFIYLFTYFHLLYILVYLLCLLVYLLLTRLLTFKEGGHLRKNVF